MNDTNKAIITGKIIHIYEISRNPARVIVTVSANGDNPKIFAAGMQAEYIIQNLRIGDTVTVNANLQSSVKSKIGRTVTVFCDSIRKNYYVSNEQLCEATDLDMKSVLAATKWFVEHNVIQQDQRSIRAGHNISDPEAFFFTVDAPNARKLVTTMVEIMNFFASESEEQSFSGEAEGLRHYTIASRIERSSRNRLEAIRLHGYKCQVCGFDFAETYGDLGRNYIEVHHVNPLAEQNDEHIVNPETDLVCLCANCHRMVHRDRHEVLSIDELKEIITH